MQLPDLRLTSAIIKDALEGGSCPFLQISSDSMAPLIRKGDEVQIEAVTWEKLSIGDVVVVEDNVGLLVHRYWHKYSDDTEINLLLKGDSLREYDQPISSTKLIGRVIARRRKTRILNIQLGLGSWLNKLLHKLDRIVTQQQVDLIKGDRLNRSGKVSGTKTTAGYNRLVYSSVYFVGKTATRIVDLLNYIQLFRRK